MTLAADIGDGDVLIWIFAFFLFVVWFWLLVQVFSDLFRDHETSGLAKVGWLLLVIVLPYLGVFIYLVARGSSMAGRAAVARNTAQHELDDYVRATVGNATNPADQIAQAKALLDAGTIDQSEYDALKAKALA
jgi:hypothetical protein